eukprot:COSAG06_NODE_10917_length_1596_cov_1.868403_1_plen_117_part_10
MATASRLLLRGCWATCHSASRRRRHHSAGSSAASAVQAAARAGPRQAAASGLAGLARGGGSSRQAAVAARGSVQTWLGTSAQAVPRRGLAMRVNRDIKAALVRVVGLDGAELGVLSR